MLWQHGRPRRGRGLQAQGNCSPTAQEADIGVVEQLSDVSPRRVDLLHPFDSLETRLQAIQATLDQQAQHRHDDKNEVIAFLNDL